MTEHSETRSIRKASVNVRDFDAALCMHDNDLEIDMNGSLNSITAPAFFQQFEVMTKGAALSSITIDASDLSYISSSGIRVLFLMYRQVSQKNSFRILHVNHDLKMILDATGILHFFTVNS